MMRITGFPDLSGEGLAALDAAAGAIKATLTRFGYAHAAPPIVEAGEPFLELSGEEIRARLYGLDDPEGEALVLRPDLTIPMCRMMLRAGWRGEGVARVGYVGPVFRYAPGAETLRQFTQGGAECLGPLEPALADAEIITMAMAAAAAAGVRGGKLVVGDASLFAHVLAQLPLSPQARQRLASGSLDDAEATRAAPEIAGLSTQLAAMDIEAATAMVGAFMRSTGISAVGQRPINDIVARLVAKARAADVVPDSARAIIGDYLAIDCALTDAPRQLLRFFSAHGLSGTDAVAALRHRIQLIETLGGDLSRARFRAGLKLSIAYYTGIVFEIIADKRQICGGGRYDRMLHSLDPSIDAQAVGFAIGLEAAVMAAGVSLAAQTPIASCDVAVILNGGEAILAANVATRLRAAGLSVHLTHDARPSCRFTLAIEKDEAVIRAPGEKKSRRIALSNLEAFAREIRA